MKQLLNKFLPDFVRKQLVYQKYKEHNIALHKISIKNMHVVNISCQNYARYEFLKKTVKNSFGKVLKVENYSFYFHPIAIIKKPNNIEEYLKFIGAKSRNMNKKAQKNGIVCREFFWNNHLDDIYAIHKSSDKRQGREMDKAYKEYPKEIVSIREEDFYITYMGAFKDDKLIGYVELYVYGNFIMINRILGHKNYLNLGIMNILIKHCVLYIIDNDIKYLSYLAMQNRKNNSLSAFKYRVGFRENSLLELK